MESRPTPSLRECAQRAVELAGRQHAVPAFDEIRLFDHSDARVTWAARAGYSMPQASLHTIDEVAARFDEYLRAGYAWLNLSVVGLSGSQLVLSIELPRESTGAPPGLTSVNFSGPRLDPATMAPVWDADIALLG